MQAAGDTHAPVSVLVENLFRRQAGQMLARLTRIFGFQEMDLAEDVVQEAMLKALRTWPYLGVPDNPEAWLVRVARNRAVDILRRRSILRRKEEEIGRELLEWEQGFASHGQPDSFDGLDDDQLAMIFACCHPALSPDVQVALTLKAVAGFSVSEIARAFLSKEPTIAQRIVRAKRLIQEQGIVLKLPEADELPQRLDSVLQAIYLLFNEGYLSHEGESLYRQELCLEAIRLGGLLVRRPETDSPKVYALNALMCLQAARLPARVDTHGDLLLMEQEDRSLWDANLLGRGLWHLSHSASGDELSTYHIQAGIAAIHATGASFKETDWEVLLDRYDMLCAVAPSPVAALNRAVVLSMVRGPRAGIAALDQLGDSPALSRYYLLPAARADMLRRLGEFSSAAEWYRKALAYRCTEPERRFLQKRLMEVEISNSDPMSTGPESLPATSMVANAATSKETIHV